MVMYRGAQAQIANAVVTARILARVIANADDPHFIHINYPDLPSHMMEAHNFWGPCGDHISIVCHAYALLHAQQKPWSEVHLIVCKKTRAISSRV